MDQLDKIQHYNCKILSVGEEEPVGFFSPHREIRQGDPLSPFLFISVTEGLRKMMEKARDLQWIRGFIEG